MNLKIKYLPSITSLFAVIQSNSSLLRLVECYAISYLVKEPNHFPGSWIPPENFYDMISKGKKLFLVDIRPEENYLLKRIVKIPQINFAARMHRG